MARRELPYEMIREILSRLPVKSLMRFKLVSKQWLHLITNPDQDFLNSHLNRSFLANPGILVVCKDGDETKFYYAQDYTSPNELTKFEIPFEHKTPFDYRVVNICNGLLCISDFYQENNSKAHVWNLLTGDHITLPSSPVPSRILDDIPFRDSDIMYGFGFDQVSDEYKLIRFVSALPFDITDDCHSHVTVFTLGQDSSWRTLHLQHFLPYHIYFREGSTALVEGSLHWFASKLGVSDSDDLDSPDTLVAFKIQDESFQEIPQPHGIRYAHPFYTGVGEMGGLLSIFCTLQCEYHVDVEIWEMGEYGVADSWTKCYKIVQPGVSRHELIPLGVADNGDIITTKNIRELISYDPYTNSVSNFHRFASDVWGIHTFKGSLLSPTTINRASRPAT